MKKQPRMRIRRVALLFCLALALLLCACRGSDIPAFEKNDDGEYVNPETEVSYLSAPWNYEAISRVTSRPVVRIEQDKIDDVVLYEIEKISSSQYLSTENYDLFYASNLTLPTLSAMAPTSVLVCQGADRSFVTETITDASDIAAILAAVNARPLGSFEGEDYNTFTLKFASEQYSAFYYRLTYRQYDAPIESWVLIEDADNYEVLYENAEVRVEEYKGELYAVYTFGVGVIYDNATQTFYAVGDVIADRLGLAEGDSND